MSFRYKKIKLSNLHLYEENPRFEKAFSEVEAIQKLIQDQKDKLVRLAEHIIDHGFNPADIPIVFKKDKNFIVREGNRRIAALRLVDNPNLVFSNEALKNKFLILKSQKGHLAPKQVLCVVFDNPRDADEWIRLKHATKHEGVGIEKWNSQQANRFAKGHIQELPIELQAIEILKKDRKTSKTTLNLIPSLKATNLRRLLSDPYVRNRIGLTYYENRLKFLEPEQKSLKNLEAIVQEISKPTFVVDEIYHKEDRKRFIDSIKLAKIKIPAAISQKDRKVGAREKIPYTYNSLIDPRKKLPSKTGLKIRKIYEELQTVALDIAPHASAFLLRALIEIAVKNYLKKKRVTIDQNDCAVVITSSGQTVKYDSLKKKINYIATTYVTDPDLKRTIQLLNKHSFTMALNQFLHNELYQATPSSVRDFWINAEPFFEFLVS